MAKQKIGSDKIDLDNELDLPDFDFDFGDANKDRTPEQQILSGIKEGVSSSFRNTSLIRRLIRESMPPVYAEAEDLYNVVGNNTSQLYNKAVQEIKPSIAQIAKTTDNIIPQKFKRSKDVLKSIKEWAEGYKFKGFSQEDKETTRNRNIAIEVGDVFSSLAQNQEEQKKEQDAKDAIKESIEIVRHKDNKSLFNDIKIGINSLVSYQEKITQAYQKKSLELQYRSYFAQLDLLEENKKLSALSDTYFQKITKNTALPEYVKIKDSERFKDMIKTKTMESLFGTTHSFLNKAFKNLGVKIREYTDIFKEATSAAAMGAEIVSSAGDMEGGPGWKEILATMGTEEAIKYGGRKLGGKIRKQLEKSPKVRKISEEAKYVLSNLPETATEYVNKYDYEDNWLKAGLKNIGKDIIGNQRADASIQADALENGLQPTFWNNRNSKSINEIIPGYLSRILREIQVLRTGDESIGLTSYDPYNNKFKSAEGMRRSLIDKLIPQGSIKSHEDNKQDIFRTIDPEGKLSEEQKNAVMDIMTRDKYNKRRLSPERLTSKSFFDRAALDDDQIKQVLSVFRQYFGDLDDKDNYKEKRNKLNESTSRIGRSLYNPASEIQKLVNAGYYDELRNLGLLNEEGTAVNIDNVLRSYTAGGFIGDRKPQSTKDTINQSFDKPASIIPTQTASVPVDSRIEEIVERITNTLSDNSNSLKDFLELHKENQKEFTGFVRQNVETLTALDKTLVDTGVKEEVQNTNTILERIENYLIEKLPALFIKDPNTGMPGGFDPESQGFVKDTFFNNLKGSFGKLGSFAWNKFIKPVNKAALRSAKMGTKLSLKSAGFSFKTAGKALNWAANKVLIKDIYVEGENKPRLKAAALRAGRYFDSVTKKPISRFGDLEKLQGDIVDESGEVILSLDEIPNAYTKDSRSGSFIKLTKWLGGKVLDYGKLTSNAAIAGWTGAFKAANWVRKKALDLLDQPIDIYLKGDDKPILLASIMRTGGYISERTGKPIFKPSEIDGPIMDAKNPKQYVLTLDQLKQGLVDVDGKPIKTPMMKLFGFGVGAVKWVGRSILKAGKFVTDAMAGGLNQAGNFFQGVLDALNGGTGGKKSIEVLEQIRNILDERLPVDKSHFSDRDGDGDRDGSWQDQFSSKDEDSESKKKERVNTTVKPGRQNAIDRLLGKVKGAKDSIMGLLGFGDDDEDEDGDGVDIDVTTGEPSKKRRRRKPKGKLGKLKNLVRSVGKKGVLRTAGTVLGKTAGLGLKGIGALGKAGMWGLAKALPMMGGAMSTLGAAVPAILGGIGAVLTSPVTLTAIGVGLAGYGAYKAYKYFTKKEYSNLVKMRMAQYGLSIDEAEEVPKIVELENQMLKYTKTSEDQVTFDIDDVLVTKLLKIFDINPEDTKRDNVKKIEEWSYWFSNRFKPVYSAHLTALNKINAKVPLSDVDKLDGKDKETYIGLAKEAKVNYSSLVSPFKKTQLRADHKLVDYYGDLALKEAKEQAEKESKDPAKKSAEKIVTEGAVTAGTASAIAGAVSNEDKAKSITPVEQPKQIGWFADKLKKTLNVLTAPGRFALGLITPFAALHGQIIKSASNYVLNIFKPTVTALEAVRFKTYGLTEMERSKVNTLRKLEKDLLGDITFDSENKAYFNADAGKVLSLIGSEFGITDLNSPNASNWSIWFQQRFLPVYLNYVGLVRQSIGAGKASIDETRLSNQQKLDIAKAISTTMGVWVVNQSPWTGYTIGMNSTIVNDNITFLESKAKDSKLPEDKIATKTTAEQAVEDAVVQAKNNGKPTSQANKQQVANQQANQPTPPVATDSSAETTGKWDRAQTPKPQVTQPKPASIQSGNRFKSKGSFQGFGEDIDGYITEAAQKYGMDEKVLRGFVKMEAGWDNQMSPTGAIGVGQFTQGTWDALAKTPEGQEIGMTKIGKRFRTSEDPRYDKRINTLATALLAKKNADMLTKSGLEVSGENLYMMHNIGPGFIKAVKTGEASPATLRAMQLNGMKPGMTPVNFVEYQKGRFNSHYEAANNTPADTVATAIEKPKTVQTATSAREAVKTYTDSKAANVGPGYASSVEKTKPTPGTAVNPTYRPGDLKPDADEFASIMKRNRETINRSSRPQIDSQIAISTQLNNSVSSMHETLKSSLNVQTETLTTLKDIKTNIVNLVNKAPQPETTKKPEPETLNTAKNSRAPSRPTARMPTAPVAVS